MPSIQFWLFWIIGLAITAFGGAYVIKRWRHLGWGVLTAFMAIYIVSANIMVPRLIDLRMFGVPFVLVTGSIVWCFMYDIGDMVNEVYGRKKAYVTAGIAYLTNLMFVTFVYIAMYTTPIWSPDQEAWWLQFFGVAGRVLVASAASYVAANLVNISLYSRLKEKYRPVERTAGQMIKYFLYRSVTTDWIGLVVENFVFYFLAFVGTMPTGVLMSLIGSAMLVKLIFVTIDEPFSVGFRLLINRWGVERER